VFCNKILTGRVFEQNSFEIDLHWRSKVLRIRFEVNFEL
jgi:hypothetical protein